MLASEACSRRRQCRSLLCRAAFTDLPAPDGWLRRALGNDGPTIREPSLRHTGQISGTGLDDSRYFAPRSLALRTVGASTCTSQMLDALLASQLRHAQAPGRSKRRVPTGPIRPKVSWVRVTRTQNINLRNELKRVGGRQCQKARYPLISPA
jgi:hypothetical protein